MSALAFTHMPEANNDWETWELNVLKEQYPTMGIKIPELMHRTPTALIHMAGKNNIKRLKNKPNPATRGREPWEQWEFDELDDNYCYYGTSIPSLRHRSRAALQAKANERNLRYEWKLKTTKEMRT